MSRLHRWLAAVVVALVTAGAVLSRRRRAATGATAVPRASRSARNVEVARLGASIGAATAATSARKVFASAERREALDRELELKTAKEVAESLGSMKGALMKIGQMASYLDDGLPAPVREALAQLQSAAPPMAPELAASVVEQELGAPPSAVFLEWDPVPIAAASIGQVHRALVHDPVSGRDVAVAVKVQYPGVGDAIAADLDNADLLGSILGMLFKGLDPDPLVEEIRQRVVEELDYVKEADNQRLFAAHFDGHPFIHVPAVLDRFSTKRVLTTELADGVGFDELLTWDQAEKDLAAEAIFRFVFRSLYRFRAFNGDPHPGNYLFRPGGQVTFLDFGLVKRFTQPEVDTFEAMVKSAAIDRDWGTFRTVVEDAGLLRRHAPVTVDEVGQYFAIFYETVLADRQFRWQPEYATSLVRRTFDREPTIAQFATVPPAFVLIQRINLGLVAILGRLHAEGNYRRIAEELWPMVQGPPSTPMGEAEAAWIAGAAAG